MPTPRILAFAGSLRTGSYNKKLVRIAARGAEAAGADVTLIDLRDFQLPIYDGDLEADRGVPEPAMRLKDLFKRHQGLLISSPEYNSSISGTLKNTIDWVSRPVEGETPLECFAGKFAAIMSASPGALGGLRGLVHLRAILSNIRVHVIPDQRAVSRANEAFDAEGELKDEKERKAIEGLGATLAKLLEKVLR